jgi:hypothetical protein
MFGKNNTPPGGLIWKLQFRYHHFTPACPYLVICLSKYYNLIKFKVEFELFIMTISPRLFRVLVESLIWIMFDFTLCSPYTAYRLNETTCRTDTTELLAEKKRSSALVACLYYTFSIITSWIRTWLGSLIIMNREPIAFRHDSRERGSQVKNVFMMSLPKGCFNSHQTSYPLMFIPCNSLLHFIVNNYFYRIV